MAKDCSIQELRVDTAVSRVQIIESDIKKELKNFRKTEKAFFDQIGQIKFQLSRIWSEMQNTQAYRQQRPARKRRLKASLQKIISSTGKPGASWGKIKAALSRWVQEFPESDRRQKAAWKKNLERWTKRQFELFQKYNKARAKLQLLEAKKVKLVEALNKAIEAYLKCVSSQINKWFKSINPI